MILRRFKINKINRAKLVNGLVSDQKNKSRNIFRVSDLHGYYSIIKNISFADKNIKEKFKINSFTLDQLVFEKYKPKKVDFIKIDTEGAEYEILIKSTRTMKNLNLSFIAKSLEKKIKCLVY